MRWGTPHHAHAGSWEYYRLSQMVLPADEQRLIKIAVSRYASWEPVEMG
jgi:hypothetical protein